MKVTPVTEIKTQFSAYIKACREEPIAITKNGKLIAVLLSIDDEEELERLILGHSRKFQAILETGKQQIQEGKGISHEEFWEEIGA